MRAFKVFTAPESINHLCDNVLFLAGSIEDGKAANWQSNAADAIGERTQPNLTVLNPRRSKWEPVLVQSANNQMLADQIVWEQQGLLKYSTHVLFNFLPNTQSPITLLEFGQISVIPNLRENTVVCCPPEYFRYANVQVVCALNNITLVHDLDTAISIISLKINS